MMLPLPPLKIQTQRPPRNILHPPSLSLKPHPESTPVAPENQNAPVGHQAKRSHNPNGMIALNIERFMHAF
tara:strand:+ start:272 stop:484 length:213 start_codon:yes stop_codon:yes gene_type:complete